MTDTRLVIWLSDITAAFFEVSRLRRDLQVRPTLASQLHTTATPGPSRFTRLQPRLRGLSAGLKSVPAACSYRKLRLSACLQTVQLTVEY